LWHQCNVDVWYVGHVVPFAAKKHCSVPRMVLDEGSARRERLLRYQQQLTLGPSFDHTDPSHPTYLEPLLTYEPILRLNFDALAL